MAPPGQHGCSSIAILPDMWTDELSTCYTDLLDGSYNCVDRIVLNAYCTLCYSAGGFRTWWRRFHDASDDELDDNHLMRMAGRFSRRVYAYAKAHGIDVVQCNTEQRKHLVAEEYLQKKPAVKGLFLILVSRAVAPVWTVKRSGGGVIQNLESRKPFVNHYSFHIMDPDWGHITIKMSGHPPFGAQIILNGHEYVACQARRMGIQFIKESNCFTVLSNPAGLAKVADTLFESGTTGRLAQICDRWIYSACLCFALDLQDQQRSGFRYEYSVYQVEYSRNLIFHLGGHMELLFQAMVDRSRARLNMKCLKTIFGRKGRPHRDRTGKAARLEVVVETPAYDLTIFKLHFGKLTLKAYTKGERVLRFEAIVHNTAELRCGRRLHRFPQIVTRLRDMLRRFLNNLYCMDTCFISDATLDRMPTPSWVGKTRVGGVDINHPRMRTVLDAMLSLACSPAGFTVGDFVTQVRMKLKNATIYDVRRGAYDLKKLRGKGLLTRVGKSRRYKVPPQALRIIAALVLLREKVIRPILAGTVQNRVGRKPKNWSPLDTHYQAIRKDMLTLFEDLGIAA